jgi:UDP-N-acetylmuramate dehydrogenase
VSAPPPGVEADAPLARLTTIGTGGPARFLARPASDADLTAILAWAAEEGMQVAVIGLGSNLLVADEGYDGVAVLLEGGLAAIEIERASVRCGGGASLAAVVRRCTEAALEGIEFGCAIPGTVGGAVRMNAGAYGSEIRDVLASADVVSARGARTGGPRELELSYRHSNVRNSEVVARAVLRLAPGVREEIAATASRARRARSARSSRIPTRARAPERSSRPVASRDTPSEAPASPACMRISSRTPAVHARRMSRSSSPSPAGACASVSTSSWSTKWS